MHLASVGISKVCFLCSLVLCGLLFLLIPALKPPAQQVDWPRPRAQVRPQRPHLSSGPGITAASDRLQNAESTTRLVIRLEGQEDENHVLRRSGNHQEKTGGLQRRRGQDLLLLEDVFIAVKTTRKYHLSRLELLIKTWISQAKRHVRSFSIIYCCCPCWWFTIRLYLPTTASEVLRPGAAPCSPHPVRTSVCEQQNHWSCPCWFSFITHNL